MTMLYDFYLTWCEQSQGVSAKPMPTFNEWKKAWEAGGPLQEPTSEQCTANEQVFEDDTTKGYAIWYPQMGGYVGKAVALIPKGVGRNECFEVLVWHDGEFPFAGEGGVNPVCLHHCMADQFIDFGTKIKILQKEILND